MTHEASVNPNLDLTPQPELPGSYLDAIAENQRSRDEIYRPELPGTPPVLSMHDAFTVMAAQQRAAVEAKADQAEHTSELDHQAVAVKGVAAARAALRGESLTPNEQARQLAIELGIHVAVRKDDRGNAQIVPLFPKTEKQKSVA